MRRLLAPALLAFAFVVVGPRTTPPSPTLIRPRFVAHARGPVITTDGPLEDLLGLEPDEKETALPALVKPELVAGEKWTLLVRFANAEVNDKTTKDVERHLAQADAAGVDYVVLELNTPGGSVPAGQELVRQIELARVPVVCVVDGQASSMGFYILQGCDYRVMTPRSMLMVHEPGISMSYGGQQTQWQNLAADLHATSEAMLYHESARLKVSRAELARRIEHGQSWYMNINEALKVGAVDGVASVQAVLSAYQHTGKPPR